MSTESIHYGYLGDILRKDRDRRMVWAVATGPKVDLDLQRCDPAWLKEAVPKWMKRGNVRQMHSTQLAPAGKAVEAVENDEQEWVTGIKVVSGDAWDLVEEDVYTGVSIGVRNAHISDDPTGAAKFGVIDAGDIVELSLVDYPAYQFSELKTDRASLIKRADIREALEVVAFEPVSKVTGLAVPFVKYQQPTLILPGKTATADALKLGGMDLVAPEVGPDGLPSGDAKKIADWMTLTKADSTKPYGDVEYADPGYQKDGKHRYPLDTEAHIRSAWSYINQDDNASAYSSGDLGKVKSKIKAAMKRIGAEVDDSEKAAGAEETTLEQDDDEEHDMTDPNLTNTRGRKVPSQTHVDPESTSPSVVTLATLPDGTKIETSTRKDLDVASGLQEPNLEGKAADGTQADAEIASAAHTGRKTHEHTHHTTNTAHEVTAGDTHAHEHEHDQSADHDVAPHPDYTASKAAESDVTKADGDGLQLGGDEAPHNDALNQARTALKALISQELAEDEPEIGCVEQLTSIWRQLEWWVQSEAAEAAGVDSSLAYAYWGAVATLAKTNTAKTAHAWAPALIATGEALMTQAKAAQAAASAPKAAQPDVAKDGRTISAATAAVLLDIAGATGMPADAASRLRSLAGEVNDAGADEGKSGSTVGDGPTGIEPIPMRIDPATLQLTSREATGTQTADTTSPAFDRSTAPAIRTSAVDPELLKHINDQVAETVGQVLKVVLPEALKGVASAGSVAKAADAVEATHEDATTKIAALRDELTKVAGLPGQLADIQKHVTEQIEAIKQLADNRVPVATDDVRSVDKSFVGNQSPEDAQVSSGRAIFERAMQGDTEAQAKLRKAFEDTSGSDVAVQAYAATTPHRG